MMEIEKYGFQIVEVDDKPQGCGGVYQHFLQPLFVVCAKAGFQKKEMEEFFALEQEAEGGKCRYMLCKRLQGNPGVGVFGLSHSGIWTG
jgi:hypothetical protein